MNKLLSEAIKDEIIKSKYSQKEIANILHITPQSLNSYVNNHREPSIDILFELLELLKIDIFIFYPALNTAKVTRVNLAEAYNGLGQEQKAILTLLVNHFTKINKKYQR
ncbi:MAG: helix-turn-helix transcriptional regulator [Longicatena sp.]